MTLIKQIEQIEKVIIDALDHNSIDVAECAVIYIKAMLELQGLVDELKCKIK